MIERIQRVTGLKKILSIMLILSIVFRRGEFYHVE